MKKQLVLLSLFICIISVSCKKEDQIKNVTATIINAGDIAADGCGWLIKIGSSNDNSTDNDNTYDPINLDDSFKKNGLSVIINYTLLKTEYHCANVSVSSGIVTPGIKQIKIVVIRNR